MPKDKDELKRGSWQKSFVRQLVGIGIPHNDAMIALGVACEYRQTAYIEGYGNGFNDGHKQGFEKGKKEVKKND